MKVLIIDDEPGILHIYGDKLQNSGFEVACAKNGEEGIEKAKSEQPNLILLDIIMPKFNGLDVLKTLKSDEKTKNIPIILLTNLPAEMSANKARSLGATNYLVKAEYDPSTVVNIINETLNSKPGSQT